MYHNIIGLSMILLSSSINFVGQLFLLNFSRRLPSLDILRVDRLSLYAFFTKTFLPLSKYFIAGAFLLFIGLIIWVFALKFIHFPVGFPIYVSLSIFFSIIYSISVSKESLVLSQYLGLGLLLLGIIFLVRK